MSNNKKTLVYILQPLPVLASAVFLFATFFVTIRFMGDSRYFPTSVLGTLLTFMEISFDPSSFDWSQLGNLIGYLHFPLTMLMNFASLFVGVMLFFSLLLLIIFEILSVTIKSTHAACIFHRIIGVIQLLQFLLLGGSGICFIIPHIIILFFASFNYAIYIQIYYITYSLILMVLSVAILFFAVCNFKLANTERRLL